MPIPLPRLECVKPTRLEEALVWSAVPDAYFIAGGQGLIWQMRLGRVAPRILVDILGLNELDRITPLGGGFRVGALVNLSTIARRSDLGLLAMAAGHVGTAPIRNFGTLGGNLGYRAATGEVRLALWTLGGGLEKVDAQGSLHAVQGEGLFATDQSPALTTAAIVPEHQWTGACFREFGPQGSWVPDIALSAVIDTRRRRGCFAVITRTGARYRAQLSDDFMHPALDRRILEAHAVPLNEIGDALDSGGEWVAGLVADTVSAAVSSSVVDDV